MHQAETKAPGEGEIFPGVSWVSLTGTQQVEPSGPLQQARGWWICAQELTESLGGSYQFSLEAGLTSWPLCLLFLS